MIPYDYMDGALGSMDGALGSMDGALGSCQISQGIPTGKTPYVNPTWNIILQQIFNNYKLNDFNRIIHFLPLSALNIG